MGHVAALGEGGCSVENQFWEGSQSMKIFLEPRILPNAVLKTLQVRDEFCTAMLWESINAPIAFFYGFHHLSGLEIPQMLRDFDLRFLENGLEIAHAKRRVCQQM